MTDIWTDFDPNLELPLELKNAKIVRSPDAESEVWDSDTEIDVQSETYDDDSSQQDDEDPADTLDTPSSFTIVSQQIRTGLDGTQVVDIVIEVEDVPGANSYNVRVSK